MGTFLFNWAWWVIFLLVITLIDPIQKTIRFYSESRPKCPKCGAEADFDMTFCKSCGAKIVTQCPKCQAPITGMAKFCEKCGEALYDVSTTSSSLQTSISSSSLSNEPQLNLSSSTHFCSMCGAQIPNDAKICPNCKSPL
jgi:predicted amidophosphoribosyltransferase